MLQNAEHSCVLDELELLTVEVIDVVGINDVIEGVSETFTTSLSSLPGIRINGDIGLPVIARC